ncbi:MAG: adenylyltransferase/cytidyltransferase family protein [Chitinispirillaceae bacterium]|nr:adenylyltransferase/cytidyltransferase family protein [Chitinispirillaceae bacterium]
MEVIDITKETIDKQVKTAVTIGNFDGVHCGHRYLIETTIQQAYKNGLKSVVLIFEPHTKFTVGEKNSRFNILTTFEEKKDSLMKSV